MDMRPKIKEKKRLFHKFNEKNMVFKCLYMVTNKYNLGRCKFILHKLR